MELPHRDQTEDHQETWRFETKYRLNNHEYYALRNAIAPYMKPDSFTKSAELKKYLVRSLYFDTDDYRFYNEKVDGICNRMKFRIRTYGTDPTLKPDIRVEIKARKGNIMEKHGSYINHYQFIKFMSTRKWNHQDDPVLNDFQSYVLKWNLLPKTLVEYLREGYICRIIEELRITFDHNVSSAPASTLFPENIFWYRHYGQQIVLEIKHKNNIPTWLQKLIQHFHLKVVPNSKYAKSIEVSPRNVITASSFRF